MSAAAPSRDRDSAEPRVLLVAPEPFYEDRGTPIAVRHVLRALAVLGYPVDVLTYPVGRDIELPGTRIFRVPNWLEFHSIPIGFSLRKVFLDLHLWFALMRRLRQNRYVMIHAVEESAFLAVLAARRRIPVLYDMQSSMAEQMAERWWLKSGIARRLLVSCERWLLERADAVICSAGLADRVSAVAPGIKAREWLYPGQEAPALHPLVSTEPSPIRDQLDISDRQRLVMYTGNFTEYQGLPVFVAAMPLVLARSPDTVFVLVGAQPGRVDAGLTSTLSRIIPADAYRIVGRVPQALIPAYLAAADVLVSPRIVGSNLPLKIFDYLAAGRPIVATDIHAHRSVLDERMAELAAPTPEGMAGAILRVLTDDARASELRAAAAAFAEAHSTAGAFSRAVGQIYEGIATSLKVSALPGPRGRVSVVIPARNAEAEIEALVVAVRRHERPGLTTEIIVVDDGSNDRTAEAARRAGAVVLASGSSGGNPALARNIGAAAASGDPIVFLDADCTPRDGWLDSLMAAHARGEVVVGGSLAAPADLATTARWDYYFGWYHAHPRCGAGYVPNHPPCNLSVRRDVFRSTGGFTTRQPIAYAHEELAWQGEIQRRGHRVYFAPQAVVEHRNRPGLGNLLRRHYRWAYSAIESKSESGIARLGWMYRHPLLPALLSLPLAPLEALYIAACWLRAGIVEPLLVFPALLAARIAYGAGALVGGLRYLARRRDEPASPPRWL